LRFDTVLDIVFFDFPDYGTVYNRRGLLMNCVPLSDHERRLRRCLIIQYNNSIMKRCQLSRLLYTHNRKIFAFIGVLALQSSTLCYSADTLPVRSKLRNPFCSIRTYIQHDLNTHGRALIESDGRASIQIGPDEAAGDPAYRDFLMAHECCHHLRGHLERLEEKGRKRALLDMSFVNRSLELDADCCAAVALERAGQQGAIREAARRMRIFGVRPTGSGGYPAGELRARFIEQCAASAQAQRPLIIHTPDSSDPVEPPAE
jgi:hypothetical protein